MQQWYKELSAIKFWVLFLRFWLAKAHDIDHTPPPPQNHQICRSRSVEASLTWARTEPKIDAWCRQQLRLCWLPQLHSALRLFLFSTHKAIRMYSTEIWWERMRTLGTDLCSFSISGVTHIISEKAGGVENGLNDLVKFPVLGSPIACSLFLSV